MRHSLIGICGTVASVTLSDINSAAGTAAGVLTAAYMARKLYLSFQVNRRRR